MRNTFHVYIITFLVVGTLFLIWNLFFFVAPQNGHITTMWLWTRPEIKIRVILAITMLTYRPGSKRRVCTLTYVHIYSIAHIHLDSLLGK